MTLMMLLLKYHDSVTGRNYNCFFMPTYLVR